MTKILGPFGARLAAIAVSAVAMMGLALPAKAQTVELKVYEWEGYISTFQAEFEQYARKSGMDIKLKFLTGTDGKIRYITSADDIFDALRRELADVVTPTHNYYKQENAKIAQLLVPIDKSRIRNWSELFLPLQSMVVDGFGPRGVPLLGGSYALAYNAAKVPAPESWRVLLAPEAKGKIMVTNDQFEANIYQLAILAGVEPAKVYDIDAMSPNQIKKVADDLSILAANSNGFWGGLAQPDQMKDLNYITDYWFSVAMANKAGQNWKIAKTKEPVTVWLDTVAIGRHVDADAKKLAAAYLLVDFMISRDIQIGLHKAFGSVIVNATAREALKAESPDLPGAEFFTPELFWQPLSPRTRNGYRQMWKTALGAAGKS